MTRFGLVLALQAAGFDGQADGDGDLAEDMAPVATDDGDSECWDASEGLPDDGDLIDLGSGLLATKAAIRASYGMVL